MADQQSRERWWKNARGEWYIIIQTFLFALVALGPNWPDARAGLPTGWYVAALVSGVVLGAAGLFLAIAGVLALGNNLSVLPHPKDDATLTQAGVYCLVRHPIYSGLVIGAAGWALINISLLTLGYAVILFAFFDIKSRREERWLVRKFPEYVPYQQRVRKLLPFVY